MKHLDPWMAIPGLSTMIQKGFRGSLLLVGPSGSGKSLYAKQFLCGTLQAGNPAVYAFTDKGTSRMMEEFAPLGVNVGGFVQSGSLKMVDLHSRLHDASESRAELGLSDWIRGRPSKMQTKNWILGFINQALEGTSSPNFVFDSITTLSLRTSEKETEIFVQELLDRLRSLKALSIFVLTSGVHGETFAQLVRSQFDGVLEIKAEESEGGLRRSLRVASLQGVKHDSGWIEYDISEGEGEATRGGSTRCAWCSKPILADPLTLEELGDVKQFDTRNCLITYRKLKSVYGEAFR
jgi:KaiC/GvpD/RAD55 family RecA-like ATPase